MNTKRMMIACKCGKEEDPRYPCRLCRQEKCIAVGMQKSKVQGPRDKNNLTNRKLVKISDPSTSMSTSPSSFSVESPPELKFSRIEFGIKPRNTELINLIAQNYQVLETSRSAFFRGEKEKREVNVYEFSLEIKMDVKFVWKLCETTFPEFVRLKPADKKTIFYNFYTRWNVLEIALMCIKFKDPYNFYTPLGGAAKSIVEFYASTLKGQMILTGEEILRVFSPYWSYHFQHVINPLVALNLGEMENMALFGIMLWDPAYTNITPELGEVCYAMRKIILRELNSYFEETNHTSSMRFFETLDTLGLVERAEHKCQEEIELCGVYNFEVDEDMRNMFMWEKY